jgi:hypothetical protein
MNAEKTLLSDGRSIGCAFVPVNGTIAATVPEAKEKHAPAVSLFFVSGLHRAMFRRGKQR